MATLNLDLTIEGGADFSVPVQVKEGGNNRTLVNGAVFAQIKALPNDRSPLVAFTSTYANRASGAVTLSLSASQTRTLPVLAYYDILVRVDNGKTFKVAYGKVNTNPAITEEVL